MLEREPLLSFAERTILKYIATLNGSEGLDLTSCFAVNDSTQFFHSLKYVLFVELAKLDSIIVSNV